MKRFFLGIGLLLSAFVAKAEGISSYAMVYKDIPVINPSKLGLELNNKENLLDGFEVVKASTSSFDETWQPVWGGDERYTQSL